jgi:hypothetical protein
MRILLEESGVPKKMKRKTQQKKTTKNVGPPRVTCLLRCLFIRTKVQWLLDESLDLHGFLAISKLPPKGHFMRTKS